MVRVLNKTHSVQFDVAGATVRARTHSLPLAGKIKSFMYLDKPSRLPLDVFDFRIEASRDFGKVLPRVKYKMINDYGFFFDARTERMFWGYEPAGIAGVADRKRRRVDVYVQKASAISGYTLMELGFLIPMVFLLRSHRRYFMHSSCVADRRGRALLILGRPFAGKTSLALGLVRRGYRVLSDESNVLWREKNKFFSAPFPRKHQIKDFTLKRFPEIKPQHYVGQTKGRAVVSIDSLRKNARCRKAQIAGLVYLRYAPGRALKLRPVSVAESAALTLSFFRAYMGVGFENEHIPTQLAFMRLLQKSVPGVICSYGNRSFSNLLRVIDQKFRMGCLKN